MSVGGGASHAGAERRAEDPGVDGTANLGTACDGDSGDAGITGGLRNGLRLRRGESSSDIFVMV